MRTYGHFRVTRAEASSSVPRGDARYAGLTEVFMKLRRALATAAATAALAPLALLSAPAALATEGGTTTPGATANETPAPPGEPAPGPEDPAEKPADKPGEPGAPGTPGDPADPANPGNPGTPGGDDQKPGGNPGDTPGEKPGQKPGEEPGGTPGGKPGEPGTEPGGKPGGKPGEKPGGDEGGKPPAEDDGGKDPSPEPCEVDDDTGEDLDSQLELGVTGLPGKIVAGSGWHEFTLTATNRGDEDLGDVDWLVAADNFSDSEHAEDWLSTYARIQYFDRTAKGWKSIVDEAGDGSYFDKTTLGPDQRIELELRLDISAKAPAGPGYALGLGGYTDAELGCEHSSFSFFEFTVLEPGSDNEDPGEAEETPAEGTHRPAPRPQGGAKEIRRTSTNTFTDTSPTGTPTGSLAETGSSSMLPAVGVVGGVAVAVGAGAVFMVRRRGHSDAA